MKAREILQPDERAVAIFTDGRNLEINPDGTGKSGVWVMAKDLTVDSVIIYFRNKPKNVNEIYLGTFSNLSPSMIKDLENRFVVEFTGTKFIGFTNENWNEFTETNRGANNPIKYIKGYS